MKLILKPKENLTRNTKLGLYAQISSGCPKSTEGYLKLFCCYPEFRTLPKCLIYLPEISIMLPKICPGYSRLLTGYPKLVTVSPRMIAGFP